MMCYFRRYSIIGERVVGTLLSYLLIKFPVELTFMALLLTNLENFFFRAQLHCLAFLDSFWHGMP